MHCHLLSCVVLAHLVPATALAADDVATEKPRVLVLEPSSEVVDKQTLTTIASLMLVELSKSRSLDVISAGDVRRLAELEGEKQSMGCADSSCLAELAGAMGARYVVFGDVGQLGTLLVLNLNLFDSAKATAVNRVTVKASGVEDLAGKLDQGVRELVVPLFPAPTATTATPVATTADAPATTETATVEEPYSPFLTWGLIGAGVLVLGGASAFDLLSPTSDDDRVDGFDAIGAGGILVGVAMAGTGAVLIAVSP